MRLGIYDHFGWAVAVTADGHEVVDRRRIGLVEPGVTPAPIHYESARLSVEATADLVAEVRASIARAAAAALAELGHARGWEVHLFDAKAVEGQAAALLGERTREVLHGLGTPWTRDHRIALAATIVAVSSPPA